MVVVGSRSWHIVLFCIDLRAHRWTFFVSLIEAALYLFICRSQIALVLLLFPELGTLGLAEGTCFCRLRSPGQLSCVYVVRARAWVQIGLRRSLDTHSRSFCNRRCLSILTGTWSSGRLLNHVVKLSRSVLSVEPSSFGRCTPSRSVLLGAWVAKLQIVARARGFPTFDVAVPVVSIRLVRDHGLP